MGKFYFYVKNYHSFQVLPETVKSKLNISSELFKREDIDSVVKHEGNVSLENFVYLHCSICQKQKVPMLLKKIKRNYQNLDLAG